MISLHSRTLALDQRFFTEQNAPVQKIVCSNGIRSSTFCCKNRRMGVMQRDRLVGQRITAAFVGTDIDQIPASA